MSEQVKRYDCELQMESYTNDYLAVMEPYTTGDYVKFEDYAALQERIKALEDENAELLARAEAAEAAHALALSRIDWTVGDNVKKATKIIDLQTELSTLRESMRNRYIYPKEGEQMGDLQPGLEYYSNERREWVPSGIASAIYRESDGQRYRAKLPSHKPPEDSSERDGGQTVEVGR